jgi:hypothetical protein
MVSNRLALAMAESCVWPFFWLERSGNRNFFGHGFLWTNPAETVEIKVSWSSLNLSILSDNSIWLWINTYTSHFLGDEHPFTSYFDVYQGYKVLTHCHLKFGDGFPIPHGSCSESPGTVDSLDGSAPRFSCICWTLLRTEIEENVGNNMCMCIKGCLWKLFMCLLNYYVLQYIYII